MTTSFAALPPSEDPPLSPSTTPSPNPPAPSPTATSLTNSKDRLSIPFPLRLPLSSTVGAFAGFGLGLKHGSAERGLRFRAENAHRFPTTQTGWYLYHKSKNYHMALGGIIEGLKMGAKLAFWAGLFCGMEEFVDRGRAGLVRQWRGFKGAKEEDKAIAGNRDLVSSMFAGLGTAGAFSAWNRFPVPTTVRLAKMGAKVGLAFGLAQDAAGLLRGRRLGYVEFVKSRVFGVGSSETQDMEAMPG